jgi:glutamate carboxypeptidase
MPEPRAAKQFLEALQPKLQEMLKALKRLVEAESPSLEKTPADRCCDVLVKQWSELGLAVERLRNKHLGDNLRIIWRPEKKRATGQLLVIGHYDTVYESGSLARMRFRVAGKKAYGPGTFDMKAGLVQALFAVDALQRTNTRVNKRVVFAWTSDEEIGSECGRTLIEREARRSDAVFVLEPAYGSKGLLKTSRKAVGEAEIVVHGRASHAGLAPEEGVNAVHELARQIARIEQWNDPRRGVTVNADVIEGGSRTNVIAERARAVLDLRAVNHRDVREIERRLQALKPILPGARLEVHGGFDRPPLEHKVSAGLFKSAKSLASEMGLAIGECAVGGGSDGNFTAALGIPTLDGLGAVGDGAHSSHEHILVESMPKRAALLAALLTAT